MRLKELPSSPLFKVMPLEFPRQRRRLTRQSFAIDWELVLYPFLLV
jgi:hypothetical protein